MLLAVFFCIPLFSCGDGIRPIKASKEELRTVAKILGEEVKYDEIRYLAYSYKLDMAMRLGEDIWNDPSEEHLAELREKIENVLLENAALISYYDEYDIDMDSSEVENTVNSYINEFAEEIGEREEYKKYLEENYLTDRYLRYILSIELCRETLRTELLKDGSIDASDETFESVVKSDEFARTLHVYIGNDAGDDIEENRKLAEKVVSLLDSGEPMTRMIGRYSEDVYMTTTDGYYFMRGEYEKAYEDTAFSLGIGEYSGVVEGEKCFYVIMRLEKEDDYINRNFETLKDQYIYVMLDRLLDEKKADAEIDYTEFGKGLDLSALN